MPPVDQHLFQLNLLLWMSLPGSSAAVRPILNEVGYEMWAISPEIRSPVAKLARLRRAGAKEAGRAELLLYRKSRSHALLIECKADSFTLASTNSPQLILLCAVTDNELRDAVGIDPAATTSSDLLYVLPKGRPPMTSTFSESSARLQAEGLSGHAGCVLELDERDDGVYAGLVGVALRDSDLEAALRSPLRVMSYSDRSQDWRPLYLIPIDPSVAGLSADPVGRAILEERVRTPLLAQVGRSLGTDFEIDVGALLRGAIAVWDIWAAPDDKKSLSRFATDVVRTLLNELSGAGAPVTGLGGRRYRVGAVSPELAARMRRAIARSTSRNLPLTFDEAMQAELFEDS